MCGFGGVINYNKEVHLKTISSVATKVNFRGPDNTTSKVYDKAFNSSNDKGNIALFHNRLSIIDHDSRSNQPFENSNYLLLFNGEIYNHIELKNELLSNGFVFNTTSDTEVLFYSLISWGEKAIPKLNGIFSFVFIEKKDEELFNFS